VGLIEPRTGFFPRLVDIVVYGLEERVFEDLLAD
jgi:hypothetical protein